MTQPPPPPVPPAQPVSPAAKPLNPKKGRGLVIAGSILVAIAAIAAVIGIVALAVGAGSTASTIDAIPKEYNNLPTVDVPDSSVITLNPGTLQIWVVASNGERPDPTAVTVTVRDKATGDELFIVPTTNEERFNSNTDSGVLAATVLIPAQGEYEVTTDGPTGYKIAIGKIDIGKLVGGIIGAVFGIIAGVFSLLFAAFMLLLGGTLLIVGLVQRSSTKKALAIQ